MVDVVVAHFAPFEKHCRAARRVHQVFRALKPRHKQKRQRHGVGAFLRAVKVYGDVRVLKYGKYFAQFDASVSVRAARAEKGYRLLV